MQRAIITGLAAILAIGCAANGQARETAPSSQPPTLSASMAQSAGQALHVHRERRRLKPGMVIKDRQGARIGTITEINRLRDGRPAVVVDVNGTPIKIRASLFRIARDRDEAVVSLTRSQIRTSAILNTP